MNNPYTKYYLSGLKFFSAIVLIAIFYISDSDRCSRIIGQKNHAEMQFIFSASLY